MEIPRELPRQSPPIRTGRSKPSKIFSLRTQPLSLTAYRLRSGPVRHPSPITPIRHFCAVPKCRHEGLRKWRLSFAPSSASPPSKSRCAAWTGPRSHHRIWTHHLCPSLEGQAQGLVDPFVMLTPAEPAYTGAISVVLAIAWQYQPSRSGQAHLSSAAAPGFRASMVGHLLLWRRSNVAFPGGERRRVARPCRGHGRTPHRELPSNNWPLRQHASEHVPVV